MQCNPGKVVTKHQFSELLHVNKAWSKTVTPLTICAGFGNSEVFPFNPEAIDCSVSVENPNATLAHSQGNETENDDKVCGDESQVFSEELFQTRYKEGYDLLDPEYLHWLTSTIQNRFQLISRHILLQLIQMKYCVRNL